MGAGGRDQWQSSIGFILATVGSAIGLGNIWRFPTVVAQSGGGAFVIVFLAAVLLVGIPAMIAELALGRQGRGGVVVTFQRIASKGPWRQAGKILLLVGFVMASYYGVIASWTLIYTVQGALGGLTGLDAVQLNIMFDSLVGNPVLAFLALAAFLGLVGLIVGGGVGGGIERASIILMPTVMILLLALFIRTMFLPGAWEGVLWFLRPDFSVMTPANVLGALGQVFFSFSLGMGAILTYGSYLSERENIPRAALWISGADVVVALLAGLTVIPALFAFNLDPQVGAGLVFVALPGIFNTMPLAGLWMTLFFALLAFAALTSAVSMLEVVTAYLIDKRRWPRRRATLTATAAAFAAGLPITLSQGNLNALRIGGVDLLTAVDFFASNLLLPVGGLVTVLFVGWVWGAHRAADEVTRGAVTFPSAPAWSFTVRYVLPAILIYVLVTGLTG